MKPLQKNEPDIICQMTKQLLLERNCLAKEFINCSGCRLGKAIRIKYGFVFNRKDPDLPSFWGGPEA